MLSRQGISFHGHLWHILCVCIISLAEHTRLQKSSIQKSIQIPPNAASVRCWLWINSIIVHLHVTWQIYGWMWRRSSISLNFHWKTINWWEEYLRNLNYISLMIWMFGKLIHCIFNCSWKKLYRNSLPFKFNLSLNV